MFDIKLIRETPNKNWKLRAHKDATGREIIDTGWVGSRWDQDSKFYEIENRVIHARLSMDANERGRSKVVFSLKCADGLHTFETGVLGVAAIVQALQKGHLVIAADGWIAGWWTFLKQGDSIYIFPTDPDGNIFKGK